MAAYCSCCDRRLAAWRPACDCGSQCCASCLLCDAHCRCEQPHLVEPDDGEAACQPDAVALASAGEIRKESGTNRRKRRQANSRNRAAKWPCLPRRSRRLGTSSRVPLVCESGQTPRQVLRGDQPSACRWPEPDHCSDAPVSLSPCKASGPLGRRRSKQCSSKLATLRPRSESVSSPSSNEQ